MLYYKLNKDLSVDQLVNDLNKLLQDTRNKESCVLVISCQKIINYAGDNPLPKIEYKGDCST